MHIYDEFMSIPIREEVLIGYRTLLIIKMRELCPPKDEMNTVLLCLQSLGDYLLDVNGIEVKDPFGNFSSPQDLVRIFVQELSKRNEFTRIERKESIAAYLLNSALVERQVELVYLMQFDGSVHRES